MREATLDELLCALVPPRKRIADGVEILEVSVSYLREASKIGSECSDRNEG